jgi:hypothetical protein
VLHKTMFLTLLEYKNIKMSVVFVIIFFITPFNMIVIILIIIITLYHYFTFK